MSIRKSGEVKYEFDAESSFVLVTMTGAVTLDQRKAFWDVLAVDETYSGEDLLCDLTECTSTLSVDEQKELVRHTGQYLERFDGVRMAQLVASDASFGLSRMSDMLGDGGGINVVPFRSREEALEWLSGDDYTDR